LQIPDEFTSAQLSRFRYELESYRLLYGTGDDRYGPKYGFFFFFFFLILLITLNIF
jgi:hypothetical protein